jgi:hypothetical protein
MVMVIVSNLISKSTMVGGWLLDDRSWPRMDEQQRYRFGGGIFVTSGGTACSEGKKWGAYFVEDGGFRFNVILKQI